MARAWQSRAVAFVLYFGGRAFPSDWIQHRVYSCGTQNGWIDFKVQYNAGGTRSRPAAYYPKSPKRCLGTTKLCSTSRYLRILSAPGLVMYEACKNVENYEILQYCSSKVVRKSVLPYQNVQPKTKLKQLANAGQQAT
jgi:hypothetical protein